MSRRSWPLLLLALAAFIPGIGFLCGATAIVWGLLTDRPGARLAIGLGAAGALLQMAIGLGLILWLQHSSVMRTAKVAKAATDLPRLVTELEAYKAVTGTYPPTLLALVAHHPAEDSVSIYDPTTGLFRPHPYIYRPSATAMTFDLFSVGPDGQADTPDDLRPVLPDSVRATTGYRSSP